MKRLINRLICLFSGHRWRIDWGHKYMKQPPQDITPEELYKYYHIGAWKCARCGKIKEEVI